MTLLVCESPCLLLLNLQKLGHFLIFFMCNNLGPGWGPCLNLLENEIESRNEMQAVYVREGGLMIIYHIRDDVLLLKVFIVEYCMNF